MELNPVARYRGGFYFIAIVLTIGDGATTTEEKKFNEWGPYISPEMK